MSASTIAALAAAGLAAAGLAAALEGDSPRGPGRAEIQTGPVIVAIGEPGEWISLRADGACAPSGCPLLDVRMRLGARAAQRPE